MITIAQMQRYKDAGGDVDAWVRSQKDGLDGVLSGDDWNTIDKLVQRLKIQKNGTASADYKAETERVLKKNLENEEVIKLARTMA